MKYLRLLSSAKKPTENLSPLKKVQDTVPHSTAAYYALYPTRLSGLGQYINTHEWSRPLVDTLLCTFILCSGNQIIFVHGLSGERVYLRGPEVPQGTVGHNLGVTTYK